MLVSWLLIACSGSDPLPGPPLDSVSVQTGSASTGTSGTTGATGSTGETADTAQTPLPPLMAEALSTRCPDPAKNLERLPSPGDDLFRATLTGTTAMCNDGSPPVLYVRPATDPAHADDWVVMLDGGGSCLTYEDCAERWCHEGFQDASKMSSLWAPPAIRDSGILGATSSSFGGWNAVMVYYCSSDHHIGRAVDRVLTDGVDAYRIHFDGHGIVLAALDALEAGVVTDDGAHTLPSLSGATRVVFSGTSAGAQGAALMVDDVAARLPSANVVGVVDSIIHPVDSAFSSPKVGALYATAFDAGWREYATTWDAAPDTDCAPVLGDEDCADLSVVWPGGWTSTPTLLHYDLYDRTGSPIDDILTLPDDVYAATIGRALDSVAAGGLGVHATACHQHQAINGAKFVTMGVGPVTLEVATQALLDGQELVVVDSPAATLSTCPPWP